MKPRLFVLLAAFALPAAASVDLTIRTTFWDVPILGAGRSFTLAVIAENFGTEASPATAAVPLPPGSTYVRNDGTPWRCSSSGDNVVCSGTLGPGQAALLQLVAAAPLSEDGFHFVADATIEGPLPDANPRDNKETFYLNGWCELRVDSAGDNGAGSLRDVLDQANEHCVGGVPCRLTFTSPMTIQPQTPLPAIRGCGLFIDAGTEGVDRFQDFSHPRRVKISGANVDRGNGLEIRSTCSAANLVANIPEVTLRGLAINGFPEDGVLIAPDVRASVNVTGCFIGTDATGMRAVPNRWRGISFESPGAGGSIGNSIVSGNGRSGISIWSGEAASVYATLIGVSAAFGVLGNGASGIFTNSGTLTADYNVIAANGQFGVAVGGGAVRAVIENNSVHDNGGIGVDWGLDGPSAFDPSGRVPPTPRLIDAFYDAARDVTVVHGVLPIPPATRQFISGYGVEPYESGPTSAGYGGDEPLPGRFIVIPDKNAAEAPFTIELQHDHRGRTITAQAVSYSFFDLPPLDSSEFSAPLLVP
ncbi:MAG TPA: right-handed parallel beta-helix repeat-containing protein [Thermoanaerobaculia bacterium]|nr:right-handed parallel beta-helix repeat-containing protein [Thermoanaerobaculia bacterium]